MCGVDRYGIEEKEKLKERGGFEKDIQSNFNDSGLKFGDYLRL